MRDDFVLQKDQQWSNYVRTFAAVALSQPQTAFAAVTKSLQFERTFLTQVTPRIIIIFFKMYCEADTANVL